MKQLAFFLFKKVTFNLIKVTLDFSYYDSLFYQSVKRTVG